MLDILCSNRGFSKNALHKASRVGIAAISVLKSAEGRIQSRLLLRVLAASLVVHRQAARILVSGPSGARSVDAAKSFGVRNMMSGDQAVKMLKTCVAPCLEQDALGRTLPDRFDVIVEVDFCGRSHVFDFGSSKVTSAGFSVFFRCSRTIVHKFVAVRASLAQFDHVAKRITIPDKQLIELELDRERSQWRKLPKSRPIDAEADELVPRLALFGRDIPEAPDVPWALQGPIELKVRWVSDRPPPMLTPAVRVDPASTARVSPEPPAAPANSAPRAAGSERDPSKASSRK